jgi:hypothetical protein
MCRSDNLKWHDAHTKFRENWFMHSGNIEVITLQYEKATVLMLLMGMIYDVPFR